MDCIETIHISDKYYPEKLRQIYDPPKTLYVRGNKEILNHKGISIIGCRTPTSYGERVAKEFAYNLSKHNINIISGGARGIDTSAHVGALNAGGKTIVVIGSGLDITYPPENKYLYERVVKNGGTIISEYTLGTKPLRYHFPARNRIISGMSEGLIVVEARKKSGTLITVDFALDHGKNIYVVPGNIDSENSYGTNELIKQGAVPLTEINQVLENLTHIDWNFETFII